MNRLVFRTSRTIRGTSVSVDLYHSPEEDPERFATEVDLLSEELTLITALLHPDATVERVDAMIYTPRTKDKFDRQQIDRDLASINAAIAELAEIPRDGLHERLREAREKAQEFYTSQPKSKKSS